MYASTSACSASASIRRAPSRTISSITDAGAGGLSRPAGSGTTVSMGVPSQPAFQRQPLLETSTTRTPGRYTPFSRPSRQIHRFQALLEVGGVLALDGCAIGEGGRDVMPGLGLPGARRWPSLE